MLAIVGLLVVIGSVLGGFTIAGGSIPSLFHISEIVTILGTALGTVLVSTPMPVLKGMIGKLVGVLKGGGIKAAVYLDTLKMLYELFQIARKDGLVAIEAHIEGPDKSAVFKKYPDVLHHHHAVQFLCDNLRLVLVGSVPPHDLDGLMDAEIEAHHHDEEAMAGALQKVADALPGIGIVAAVLGIIVTMAAISGPVEQIGEHVGAALTGTMLGVFFAYGVFGPLATAIEHSNRAEGSYYQVLKAAIVAFAKGFAPIVAVEFSRRAVPADSRPSFQDMEAACKSIKAK
ncbi:MAG: flagellar motor stator protein MotA [Gemmatimonadales bacterium]